MWQRDLSISLNRLGDVTVEMGDLPGALRHFTNGLAIAKRLATSDPDNAVWQRDLMYSYAMIATKIHMPQEHWEEALPLMERSHAIAEKLTASDPSNVIWQNDARSSRSLVAEIRTKLGQ